MNRKLLALIFVAVFVFTFAVINKPKVAENNDETQSDLTSCTATDLTGSIEWSERNAFFEGSEVAVPALALAENPVKVLGTTAGEKWIEVDLSDQKLIAREGDRVFMESSISSGLPGTPTPKGEFRIWIKLRATKMSGGSGRGYYYLPNVPYVMFFENSQVPGRRGYGLHGTYWHNDFGRPRSHGCVNLPTENAKQLYYWVTPSLPEGKGVVRATAENPGTKIIIHE